MRIAIRLPLYPEQVTHIRTGEDHTTLCYMKRIWNEEECTTLFEIETIGGKK